MGLQKHFAAKIIFWDFDGTLIPFDSEQFLLDSLFLSGRPVSWIKAQAARLFVYGDRHGWHPGWLKVLYGWCLRGTAISELDSVGTSLAARIAPADRAALCALARHGVQMVLLSCGTGDLCQRALRMADLRCFTRIEANWLIVWNHVIAGIERRIYLPETKVEIAASYGFSWDEVIAVGDGLTDVPLLDRAGLPVLIADGDKAMRFAGRGYEVVPSLFAAIELIDRRFLCR
jgi:phosphoserine phosphatase